MQDPGATAAPPADCIPLKPSVRGPLSPRSSLASKRQRFQRAFSFNTTQDAKKTETRAQLSRGENGGNATSNPDIGIVCSDEDLRSLLVKVASSGSLNKRKPPETGGPTASGESKKEKPKTVASRAMSLDSSSAHKFRRAQSETSGWFSRILGQLDRNPVTPPNSPKPTPSPDSPSPTATGNRRPSTIEEVASQVPSAEQSPKSARRPYSPEESDADSERSLLLQQNEQSCDSPLHQPTATPPSSPQPPSPETQRSHPALASKVSWGDSEIDVELLGTAIETFLTSNTGSAGAATGTKQTASRKTELPVCATLKGLFVK